MLFSLQAFANDAAIVMTENPSRLYMVHLSSPAPRLELLALNTTGSRPIWDKFTNEIMWGEGSNIIKLSIDGGHRKLTSINGRLFLQSRINPYKHILFLRDIDKQCNPDQTLRNVASDQDLHCLLT